MQIKNQDQVETKIAVYDVRPGTIFFWNGYYWIKSYDMDNSSDCNATNLSNGVIHTFDYTLLVVTCPNAMLLPKGEEK